jgi:ribulose 1,5-bisphosphate carboxylase large subunit-like protein
MSAAGVPASGGGLAADPAGAEPGAGASRAPAHLAQVRQSLPQV